MKVLAVTGGIGSGKSYICRCFHKMGIPIYNSDERTKELYVTDKELANNLANLLGSDIFCDGVLQKNIMAKKIFESANVLERVEQIVHPAVVRDFKRWEESYENLPKNTRPPFIIIESAIILEKPNVLKVADKVLTVVAPLEIRINRVIKRDKTTKEIAMQRLNMQWSDEKRMALSDFIIFADDNTSVLKQIIDVYNYFKN